jgi:ornithine cyclodeaminase
VTACASAEEACEGAQIITTCTADKRNATVLTDNMVGAGVHINAIGGDCPGKTELHRRHPAARRDLCRIPAPDPDRGRDPADAPDHPVTELWQVITGRPGARRGQPDHPVRRRGLRHRGFQRPG